MFLLDTDTIIYFLKGHECVVSNFRAHANLPKAFSVITYGELIYEAKKSQRKVENLAKVRRLAELYPIIDVRTSVMESFGEIKAELSAAGQTVDDFDLLIGCTALSLNYTVVTNNQKHFRKIPGLKLINWAI